MGDITAIVFVIDNDPSVRAVLKDLLDSVGLAVRLFASPQEFLASERPNAPACLVLDVRLPGISGLTFQKELASMGVDLPIIFITGHGDIPMCVRAMKAGAVDFLTKPFRDQDLLDAIESAIERDIERRREQSLVTELRKRYANVTARERQIMTLVVIGLPNKQIATELDLSEMTVKVHRGQVMRKMQAGSLPELVRMTDQLAGASRKVGSELHRSRHASAPAPNGFERSRAESSGSLTRRAAQRQTTRTRLPVCADSSIAERVL